METLTERKRLIERSIETIEKRLIILAPLEAKVPAFFGNVSLDSHTYKDILHEMQVLRGSIYLQEGYAQPHELLGDGRYELPEDEKCWHVMVTGPSGRIRSTALYFDHENTVTMSDLRVRHCTLMKTDAWGGKLKGAIESEIAQARRAGLRFAELGGWVIKKEHRGTTEGLLMALATYGLSRILGGSLGIATATVANSSSATLQHMGGSHLECQGTTIPPYFDARYETHMELLRFDSRFPNQKYERLIELATRRLAHVSVISDSADTFEVVRPFQAVSAA
jgi:hypothetical protein